MIVPSSNVTMERELPVLFHHQGEALGDQFSLHSARVRMKTVSPEELRAMNLRASDAAIALADAEVDLVLYGCLIAVMVEGEGAHLVAEARLREVLAEHGRDVPVISSAGALVSTLHELGARRVGLLAPYLPALTATACAYLEHAGIKVIDSRSRSVADNAQVGRLDPSALIELAGQLRGSPDALVISACVQMPSLPVIREVEAALGIPVISAATATAYQGLKALGSKPSIHGFGRLLAPAPSERKACA